MNAQPQVAEVTQLPAVRRQEVRVVTDAEPILDTAKFEHMQRIAGIMARCDLVPNGLKVESDYERTVANCFLVVNQAVRWGMDPFSVAQCASVIHGKLCYEGKLVAAVMQKHGVNLSFKLNEKTGDALGVTVSGTLPGENEPREITGTVGQWKTKNEQWTKDPAAMLCYRGARAWSRIHNPAPMLGIYTPDELDDLADDVRAQRARLVEAPKPPNPHLAAPTQPIGTPKTPEPAAQEKNNVIPDPTKDAPAFIVFITEKFTGFADYQQGETYWNESVAIQLDGLPHDVQEDAMSVWRNFERRFEE